MCTQARLQHPVAGCWPLPPRFRRRLADAERRQLQGVMEGLQRDVAALQRDVAGRDEAIGEKEKRILDLKHKTQAGGREREGEAGWRAGGGQGQPAGWWLDGGGRARRHVLAPVRGGATRPCRACCALLRSDPPAVPAAPSPCPPLCCLLCLLRPACRRSWRSSSLCWSTAWGS